MGLLQKIVAIIKRQANQAKNIAVSYGKPAVKWLWVTGVTITLMQIPLAIATDTERNYLLHLVSACLGARPATLNRNFIEEAERFLQMQMDHNPSPQIADSTPLDVSQEGPMEE